MTDMAFFRLFKKMSVYDQIIFFFEIMTEKKLDSAQWDIANFRDFWFIF